LLALTTGARQGELLALRWEDIDFNKRTATLQETKNSETRLLTLPTPSITELMKFRATKGLVFPGKNDSNSYNFRKPWRKALAEAKVTNFRFHDLRHSAASYLVMSGATLHQTAEVLGHKSIETTRRCYAHLSTEHKKELTDRVLGTLFS
jgi:integrase